MCSIRDLNPPVVLFAGRPTDSRKGLAAFLDSVACMHVLSELPEFVTWIIGGSTAEARRIHEMVRMRPALAGPLGTGKLFIWGRIENSAMPEFYSRSSVLVVPSSREEFGIVAVEAMMCECPVVAFRTGGLEDIIASGITGTLVDPGDHAALAASITAFLRNPDFTKTYGAKAAVRARSAFTQASTFELISKVYDTEEAIRSVAPQGSPSGVLAESVSDEFREAVLSLAPKGVRIVEEFWSSQHPCFRLSDAGANEQYFAKAFGVVPSAQVCVLPVEDSFKGRRDPNERLRKTLFHSENPIAPKILRHRFGEIPVFLTEWLEPYSDEGRGPDMVVMRLAAACRAYRRLDEQDDGARSVRDCLSRYREEKSIKSIRALDEAASTLNARVDGGAHAFYRIHPQVELARLRLLLSKRAWPVAGSHGASAIHLCDGLLAANEILARPPEACHGDLKPAHLLEKGGENLACDFEQSRYVIGPIDEPVWLYNACYRGDPAPSATRMLERMRRMLAGSVDFYMGACWLAVHAIYRACWKLTQGTSEEFRRLDGFASEFLRWWRHSESTP